MDEDLKSNLYSNYPELFVNRDEDYFRLSCGNGWYWLIDKMCKYLRGYENSGMRIKQKHVKIAQIKEKFGLLRVYVDDGDSRIQDAINVFEFLSKFICMDCGSDRGTLRTEYRIVVRCDECEKEANEKMFEKVKNRKT